MFSLPNIRKIYTPDPSKTIFDIDLKSADLRIVAWESNCRLLKEWLNEGLDPYTMVAREYYHEPELSKKDSRRQRFKSLCHATHYLGIAKNIAGNANIGLGVSEVERVQSWYFTLCPEIKEWQNSLIETVNRERRVSNVYGYKSPIAARITNNTYNEMVAWIPQSSVGILINKGMVRIDKELPEIELLLQVHDSLVGQFDTELEDGMKEKIIHCCSNPLPYADPMTIPLDVKMSRNNWGECE